jgi:hypothetical protein
MSQSSFRISLFSLFQRKVMMKFHAQILLSRISHFWWRGHRIHLPWSYVYRGNLSWESFCSSPRSLSVVWKERIFCQKEWLEPSLKQENVLETQVVIRTGMTEKGDKSHEWSCHLSGSPVLVKMFYVLALSLSLILFMHSHLPRKVKMAIIHDLGPLRTWLRSMK